MYVLSLHLTLSLYLVSSFAHLELQRAAPSSLRADEICTKFNNTTTLLDGVIWYRWRHFIESVKMPECLQVYTPAILKLAFNLSGGYYRVPGMRWVFSPFQCNHQFSKIPLRVVIRTRNIHELLRISLIRIDLDGIPFREYRRTRILAQLPQKRRVILFNEILGKTWPDYSTRSSRTSGFLHLHRYSPTMTTSFPTNILRWKWAGHEMLIRWPIAMIEL